MHDTTCPFCGFTHEVEDIHKMVVKRKSGLSLNCYKCDLKTNYRLSKNGYVRAYASVELPRYYSSIKFRRTTYSAYQCMLINKAYEKYSKQ